MTNFQKLVTLFQERSLFWDKNEAEKGFIKATSYLGFIFLISIAINFFLARSGTIDMKTLASKLNFIVSGLPEYAYFFFAEIMLFLFFLVSSFVSAYVHNYFLRKFGGQGTYDKTYQAYVYSQTFLLLAANIPVLGSIAGLVTVYFMINGVAKYHKVNMWRSFATKVLTDVVLFLAMFIMFSLLFI